VAIRFAAALLQLQVVCAGRSIFKAESGRKTWAMNNGPFCLPMHALLMRPSGSLRLMRRATEIFPRSYLFSFCFFFFFPHNQFWGTQRTGRSWSRLRSFLARLDMSCLVRSREIKGLFLWAHSCLRTVADSVICALLHKVPVVLDCSMGERFLRATVFLVSVVVTCNQEKVCSGLYASDTLTKNAKNYFCIAIFFSMRMQFI
jgi:hypothetical protein